MPQDPNTTSSQLQGLVIEQPAAAQDDDFFSDAPLDVCPMRKDGMGEGEICEACQ